MSSSKSEEIPDREMPGARKELPNDETVDKHGDSASGVGVGSIGKHGEFRGYISRKFRIVDL